MHHARMVRPHVVGVRQPKVIIEAVLHRQKFLVMPKMPLAVNGRSVAGLRQQFRERMLADLQTTMMIRHLGVGIDHRRHTSAFLVTAREQSGAGRAAHHAARVVVGEAHPLARHAVEVRRLEPATVRACRVVTHVVRHDDDEVRLGGVGAQQRQQRANQA